MTRSNFRQAALAAALAASTLLGACAPLLIGGAVVGGTMVATDRRTSGTQVEDQAIELKAGPRVTEAIGDRGHVNVTSYGRIVLLTGEVQSEADKAAVYAAVRRIENVNTVINELEVMGPSSLTARYNDSVLTGKVKASFIDAKDVFSNAIKVVTERSTVFLMGRVTEREAKRATDLARSIPGVQRVVRVFDIVSEAELANMLPKPAPVSTATPEPAASAPR